MISLDSETSGIDFHHGLVKPFFVTVCDEEGNQTWWEWEVDPLTREVKVDQDDVEQIKEIVFNADSLVLQNTKFDVTALNSISPGFGDKFPWDKVNDTLLAGHILNSIQPHDLTWMASHYLGIDIAPLEETLGEACKKARREAKKLGWMIATEGLPGLPSVKSGSGEKDRTWKNDMWLPKCYAAYMWGQDGSSDESDWHPDNHPWWKVLENYSNADSLVTIKLWQEMSKHLKRRQLGKLYRTRLKTIKIAYEMEQHGITLSQERMEVQSKTYSAESQRAVAICTNIAAGMNVDLELPKSGVNNSLRNFMFDTLNLEQMTAAKSTTGNASLNKEIMGHYLLTLPERSKAYTFVKTLLGKRSLDTALQYIESYKRFMVPLTETIDGRVESSIHEVCGENKQVLELDGWTFPERIRSIPTQQEYLERNEGTSDKLSSVSQTNSRRTHRPTPVRQSKMRSPESSESGDIQGQYGRYGVTGQGHQSQGDGTSSSEVDRSRCIRDQTIAFRRDQADSIVSKIQSQSTPHERYNQQKVLEPYIIPGWTVLHPSLNSTGTNTLRWSSSAPNEQNISKKENFNLRFLFGPAPGREWWSLDAKNIELRIPAYESGEKELIELFERPDDPPYYGSNHILIFETLWPDLWAQGVKEVGLDKTGPWCKKKFASTYYQWVKNGNFAIQYGAVDRDDGLGTADRAYHQPGAQSRIKSRFVKQEALNQKWIRYAEKYGYVETMPDRSVDPSRGYPVECTRTGYGKIKPTVPLSYHVQSTAMFWTMMAMIRCTEQLDDWRETTGFDGHLVMQVHDEIVLDFPKSHLHPKDDTGTGFNRSNLWRIRKIQNLMEKGGEDIGVPTPTSAEYHADNWSEGIGF